MTDVRLPDGRVVQVWRGGDPDGPTVFFLPGCPDCRLAAVPGDAAAKRVGVRLVAVNRPGYGRSDAADSTHSSVADDVLALADALGIGNFAAIGMSLGGPYALAVAARHPGRVTAVATVASPAPSPRLDPPVHRDALSAAEQTWYSALASLSVEGAIASMRPDFAAYVQRTDVDDPDDQALAARWTSGLHPADAHALSLLPAAHHAASAREALAQPEGYLRDAALTFREWDFDVADVECPTTLYYGELDPQLSLRNGRWLADHVPRARLVVSAGTAHLSTLHARFEEILGRLTAAGGRSPTG